MTVPELEDEDIMLEFLKLWLPFFNAVIATPQNGKVDVMYYYIKSDLSEQMMSYYFLLGHKCDDLDIENILYDSLHDICSKYIGDTHGDSEIEEIIEQFEINDIFKYIHDKIQSKYFKTID